jgi:hypothetical protein
MGKITTLFNLETTVRKLIENGLSKDEILEITVTTSERYQDIIAERKYYNIRYIYLNEGETEKYELLLQEIHHSNDIYKLMNPLKEQQRIKFIHKVLLRYKQDCDEFTKFRNSDNYEVLILNR